MGKKKRMTADQARLRSGGHCIEEILDRLFISIAKQVKKHETCVNAGKHVDNPRFEFVPDHQDDSAFWMKEDPSAEYEYNLARDELQKLGYHVYPCHIHVNDDNVNDVPIGMVGTHIYW